MAILHVVVAFNFKLCSLLILALSSVGSSTLCPYIDKGCVCSDVGLTCTGLSSFPLLVTRNKTVSSATFTACNFTAIPDDGLPVGLARLVFDGVPLASLSPKALQTSAGTLQRLYLTNTQLAHIPFEAVSSISLVILTISYNLISDGQPPANFTASPLIGSLVDLSLEHTTLTAIPAFVASFQKLYSLDLGYSQIRSLDASLIPLNLNQLDLNNNNISYISNNCFPVGSKLQNVILSANPITHIEEGALRPLQQLQELYLQSTSLTRIPAALIYLGSLQTLDLDNNHQGLCACPRDPRLILWYKNQTNLLLLGGECYTNNHDLYYYLSDAGSSLCGNGGSRVAAASCLTLSSVFAALLHTIIYLTV